MESNLNTSEVTDMQNMFYYCNNLTSLNVANFNTENVNSWIRMFYNCENLTTIYCNDAWESEESDYMFASCYKFVGGNGVAYDEFELDGSYANPTTGYFTAAEGDITEMAHAHARNFANDSETTDINAINTEASEMSWFTLDGKKIDGKPSQKGMYIHGGQKVMIK